MKVTTSLGTRKERFSRKATYDYQLEAFAAAVEDGASVPDHGRRRDPYDGAHRRHLHRRRPPAPPAHPGRADAARRRRARRAGRRRARRRRRLPGGRAAGRAHPQPDRAPARRPARDDGRRHRLRHGRARRGRRRGRASPPRSTCGREEAANLVRQARRDGRASRARPAAGASSWPPSPRTARSTWSSAFEVDPATVPMADKIAPAGRVERAASVDHDAVVAHLGRRCSPSPSRPTWPTSTGPGPPSTGCACSASSRRWPSPTAGFETMRTLAPPVGRGWEFLTGPAVSGNWDWDAELAELPELLAEKLAAPSVEAGTLRPRGRPVQPLAHHPRVDRARHRARPGRRLRGGLRRHLVRHLRQARHARLRLPRHARDRRPHGRARPGHRGHRRRGRRGPVVRPRARRHPRRLPARPGHRRRHGLRALQRLRLRRLADARADPAHGQRVAGPRRRRAARAPRTSSPASTAASTSWATRAGRSTCSATTSSSPGSASTASRTGSWPARCKDVAYQATTTDFWGAMEAVGGASTWVLGGAFNCGKGQPGQVAPVSHGCPSVLVRGVKSSTPARSRDAERRPHAGPIGRSTGDPGPGGRRARPGRGVERRGRRLRRAGRGGQPRRRPLRPQHHHDQRRPARPRRSASSSSPATSVGHGPARRASSAPTAWPTWWPPRWPTPGRRRRPRTPSPSSTPAEAAGVGRAFDARPRGDRRRRARAGALRRSSGAFGRARARDAVLAGFAEHRRRHPLPRQLHRAAPLPRPADRRRSASSAAPRTGAARPGSAMPTIDALARARWSRRSGAGSTGPSGRSRSRPAATR